MPKSVLVVDDEPDVMTYLVAVLEGAGYAPYSADSVEGGLKLLEEVTPDLICLDIMMPKESGISMYLRLKQDHDLKSIPVMIISGVEHSGEGVFRSFVPDESVPAPECFMEKPIDVESYIRTIGKLTSSGAPPEKRKKA